MLTEVKPARSSLSKSSILVNLDLRLFSVSEFDRLNQLEIFDPAERLELINGEIISMAAKGTRQLNRAFI